MFWEFQCLATGFFEDFAPWKQCVLPTGKITQEEIHKLAQKLSNFQQTKSVRILLNLTGMGVNMIGIRTLFKEAELFMQQVYNTAVEKQDY